MIDNIHLLHTGDPHASADHLPLPTQPGSIEAWPQAVQAAAKPAVTISTPSAASALKPSPETSSDIKNDASKSLVALVSFATKSEPTQYVAASIETHPVKKKYAPATVLASSTPATEIAPQTTKPAPKNSKDQPKTDRPIAVSANTMPAVASVPAAAPPHSISGAVLSPELPGRPDKTAHTTPNGATPVSMPLDPVTPKSAPTMNDVIIGVGPISPGAKILETGKRASPLYSTPVGNVLGQPTPVNPANSMTLVTMPDKIPTLVPANAAGLASAITAMHQAGESSAVLRLSPPGLGSLSVHVAIGQNALINVMFIAAVPQTVQILHNNLDDLRQAMAASGLNLGQANVGGDGHQSHFSQSSPQQSLPTSTTSPGGAAIPMTATDLRAIA